MPRVRLALSSAWTALAPSFSDIVEESQPAQFRGYRDYALGGLILDAFAGLPISDDVHQRRARICIFADVRYAKPSELRLTASSVQREEVGPIEDASLRMRSMVQLA